jgi:hypothetical protein
LRAGNHPETTRYNYLLAAAQLAKYLADESDIETLMWHVQDSALRRRNFRGGHSVAEHLIGALQCLYKRAVADGLNSASDDLAQKVAKPHRPTAPAPRWGTIG